MITDIVELPGKTSPAVARLDYLSLRGANKFMNELCDMFPNVGARFQEYPDGSATLVLTVVDKLGQPVAGTAVALSVCRSDGLHRAYLIAELLDTGLPSAANKLATT